MMTDVVVLLALILVPSFMTPDGARVLMLPTTITSHTRFFARLGAELAADGHDVTLGLSSWARQPHDLYNSRMTVMTYNVTTETHYFHSEEFGKLIMQIALSETQSEKLRFSFQLIAREAVEIEKECEFMFADSVFMRDVISAGYDVMLVDAAGTSCYYMLPYSLDIPYISITIAVNPALYYRVPALPSITPGILSDNTNRMTFTQRLVSLKDELMAAYMTDNSGVDYYSEKYAPGKPKLGYYGMTLNSAMFFYMDDDIVGYARPQMPNTVSMGDVVTRPAHRLPTDLLTFVEDATDGVIIMSFGSHDLEIPPDIESRFCEAFKAVPQRVVWKLSHPHLCDIPGKLLTMTWIPQNDLLAHPNVKLFITHGGISSFFETLYHATPVIACPLFLDQSYMAKLYEAKHYGSRITFAQFTTVELLSKIEHVLSNGTIHSAVERASDILRNKPLSPVKRASYWVSHVATYGGEHLRSSAFDLNILQYYMADLYFVLFSSMLIGVILSVLSLCCLVKMVFKCNARNSKGKFKQS